MKKKHLNDEILRNLVKKVCIWLGNDNLNLFSSQAILELEKKVVKYVKKMISESIKISKQEQADTVSAHHIKKVYEYLVNEPRKRYFKHFGTIGGVLLGASLSNISLMDKLEYSSSFGIIISLIFGITGAFLIALTITKD